MRSNPVSGPVSQSCTLQHLTEPGRQSPTRFMYSHDLMLNKPYTQAAPQALLGSFYPAHIPMVQLPIIIVGEILSDVALLYI